MFLHADNCDIETHINHKPGTLDNEELCMRKKKSDASRFACVTIRSCTGKLSTIMPTQIMALTQACPILCHTYAILLP